MSCNCSYPQNPKYPIYPVYPYKPQYPCHPGSLSYPYKPHYPAYPPKPCKPCAPDYGCCYPPDAPQPPEPDCCCDGCGEDGPCCRGGNCAACAEYTKGLPYLMPRAVGCGKTEKCKQAYCLPLDPECLDRGDLPGRPPHTIVRVTGTGGTVVEECLEKDNADSTYDYFARIKVPVDIIIRDCAGFTHCLKSWFVEKVKIPLSFRVSCLPKLPLIYVRTLVSLCYPVRAETTVKDINEPGSDYEYLDICDEGPPGGLIVSFDNCPKLKVSVTACIIKLVPCGSPDDPYTRPPHKIPCGYPCKYYPRDYC